MVPLRSGPRIPEVEPEAEACGGEAFQAVVVALEVSPAEVVDSAEVDHQEAGSRLFLQ